MSVCASVCSATLSLSLRLFLLFCVAGKYIVLSLPVDIVGIVIALLSSIFHSLISYVAGGKAGETETCTLAPPHSYSKTDLH